MSRDDYQPGLVTYAPANDYYVLIKSHGVYVKEAGFFEQQGGLTQPWGKGWEKVRASSIEDARSIGKRMRKWRKNQECHNG